MTHFCRWDDAKLFIYLYPAILENWKCPKNIFFVIKCNILSLKIKTVVIHLHRTKNFSSQSHQKKTVFAQFLEKDIWWLFDSSSNKIDHYNQNEDYLFQSKCWKKVLLKILQYCCYILNVEFEMYVNRFFCQSLLINAFFAQQIFCFGNWLQNI